MIRERKDAKCPFIISNTDRTDRLDTQWWSILDIHPKRETFFFENTPSKKLYHTGR